MIEIGKLKLKCKYCGNIIGSLEENFNFAKWIFPEETKKDMMKDVLEKANQKGGLEHLTHIHLSCYCEKYGDGILSLKLDEDSDFEIVE